MICPKCVTIMEKAFSGGNTVVWICEECQDLYAEQFKVRNVVKRKRLREIREARHRLKVEAKSIEKSLGICC